MTVIVNEWQLQGQLNQAINQHRRADFGLWLALLSPAVEEMAEFCLADEPEPKPAPDLRKQFAVHTRLEFATTEQDIGVLQQQHDAFIEGGLASWRLASLLNPPPTVVCHDRKKLSAEVLDNLSVHAQRRLQQQNKPKMTTDPTQLYEMLNQLQAN